MDTITFIRIPTLRYPRTKNAPAFTYIILFKKANLITAGRITIEDNEEVGIAGIAAVYTAKAGIQAEIVHGLRVRPA